MNFMNNLKTGRRGFITVLAGILPGFILMSPGQVRAGAPKARELLRNLKKDALIKSKPKKNQSVIVKNADDDKIVLYKKGNRQPVCSMNRPGRMIWDMCNGNNTPQDMASAIQQQYAVSFEQSYADCMRFINNLSGIGAIQL